MRNYHYRVSLKQVGTDFIDAINLVVTHPISEDELQQRRYELENQLKISLKVEKVEFLGSEKIKRIKIARLPE